MASAPQDPLGRPLRPFLDLRAPSGARIALYRSDCLEGMRSLLPDGSVDVVVTSPPYNLGKPYPGQDDARPRRDYLSWMGEVARELRRVVREDGSFFLNLGGRPSDPWLPWETAFAVREAGWVLQNVIHWIKAIAIPREDMGRYPHIQGDLAVGHYKPIGGRRFLHDCHEYIFHFTPTGRVELDRLAVGVPYQDKSNVGRWRWARQDRRCRGNTWFIPYETIRNRALQRPHPASFPVKLPQMCIRLHGLERTRLVLDPFLGIGTTAVACLRLGVSCIGFEVAEEYLEAARRRLAGAWEARGP